MPVSRFCLSLSLFLACVPWATVSGEPFALPNGSPTSLDLSLSLAFGDADPALMGEDSIGKTLLGSGTRGVPCAADSPCNQNWTENPFSAPDGMTVDEPRDIPRTSLAIALVGAVLVLSLLPGGRRRGRKPL